MGNSFTCPCSVGTNKEGVLVMKSDGDLLRFKRGVHAREVVAANLGYRVVRCDSDRTVLGSSAELESHKLYFLVPEERARSRATFEKFWKVGESKGLVPPRTSAKGSSDDSAAGSFVMSSVEFRKLAWAPQLRTVPEILSPEMAKAGEDCAKMKPVQTPCNLGEQLELAAGTRPAAMMVS